MSTLETRPASSLTPARLPSWQDWAAPAIAFLAALGVYIRTMLPGVGMWDTAEFQSVPYLLGIMHTTGYPTYTLVGKLVSSIPLGSVAYRMTFFSGVCAAAAVALLVVFVQMLLARPLTIRDRLLALGAGLAFAFNQTLWHTASRADAHTLHAALALGAACLALRWHQQGQRRDLVALAVVVGLGLGNHMLMAMLVPGLAAMALAGRWREALVPRTLGPTLGAGLLALGVYAYLPLRAAQNPVMNYGKPVNWENFRQLVFASDVGMGGSLFGPVAIGRFLLWLGRLPEKLGAWFTLNGAWGLIGLAPVGLVVLVRRDWRVALGVLTLALPSLYVGVVYPNGDSARYLFIVLAMLCALAAVGVQALLGAVARVGGQPGAIAGTVAAAALALAPVSMVPANWAASDASGDRLGETLAAQVFGQLPPNAVVVSEWNEATPLWYKHYVEGVRPDVEIVYETNATDAVRASLEDGIARRLGQRPVFVLLNYDTFKRIEGRFVLAPGRQFEPQGPTLARVEKAR